MLEGHVCVGGGALPRGLGHNLLVQFYSLGSSKMVVPLPSSRCLAEGNRIFIRLHWKWGWGGPSLGDRPPP